MHANCKGKRGRSRGARLVRCVRLLPMSGIDSWLPTFNVGERHQIDVALPVEHALRHALATPAAPDRVIRLLFRLRGLDPDGSIEEFMTANGFTLLERTPTTYVV